MTQIRASAGRNKAINRDNQQNLNGVSGWKIYESSLHCSLNFSRNLKLFQNKIISFKKYKMICTLLRVFFGFEHLENAERKERVGELNCN